MDIDAGQVFMAVSAVMAGKNGNATPGKYECPREVIRANSTAPVGRLEVLVENNDVHPTKKTVSGYKKTPCVAGGI